MILTSLKKKKKKNTRSWSEAQGNGTVSVCRHLCHLVGCVSGNTFSGRPVKPFIAILL